MGNDTNGTANVTGNNTMESSTTTNTTKSRTENATVVKEIPVVCANQTVIDQFFRKNKLLMVYSDTYTDLNDPKQTVKTYLRKQFHKLKKGKQKKSEFFVMPGTIETKKSGIDLIQKVDEEKIYRIGKLYQYS